MFLLRAESYPLPPQAPAFLDVYCSAHDLVCFTLSRHEYACCLGALYVLESVKMNAHISATSVSHNLFIVGFIMKMYLIFSPSPSC